MAKNKGGRPTKYHKRYCKQIIKYFDIEPNKEVMVVTTGKNDYSKEEPKLFPNNLPTFERFAHTIGVHTDTLQEWVKKHKEFSVSYRKAQQLQKDMLVANGLTGLYQSNFAIFVAKNFTDMKDKAELEHSGELPIHIYIPKEKTEEEWAKEHGSSTVDKKSA